MIDTTIPSVEDISTLIFKLYKDFSRNTSVYKYWVSPKILFPTKLIRESGQDEARQVIQSIFNYNYDKSSLVETIKLGRDFFIWDGHKRISEAIFNKIPLIPIGILAKDDEEIHPGNVVSHFIETTFNPDWLYDWENFHGFRFESYPQVK